MYRIGGQVSDCVEPREGVFTQVGAVVIQQAGNVDESRAVIPPARTPVNWLDAGGECCMQYRVFVCSGNLDT